MPKKHNPKFFLVFNDKRIILTKPQYIKLYNLMVPHMNLEMREALRTAKGDKIIALDPSNEDAFRDILKRIME